MKAAASAAKGAPPQKAAEKSRTSLPLRRSLRLKSRRSARGATPPEAVAADGWRGAGYAWKPHLSSPLARRLAKEANIDLNRVQGSVRTAASLRATSSRRNPGRVCAHRALRRPAEP